MLRALTVSIAGPIAWVLLHSAALAQPAVTAVRLGEHPDKTRFVLELTEAPRYRVFALPDPFRMVIDLPELAWRPPSEVPGDGAGLVSAMRFGLFAPGTSRVVLDLRRPARIKSVFLIAPSGQNGHRFVVDMEPVSREAYFAAGPSEPFVSAERLEPLRPRVAAPARPKADDRPTIVIDPGHGGVDPGARSITGVNEKDVALTYGLELKRRLEASGKFRVVMTRDSDVFVSLAERRELAQRHEGALFVSLHANNHAEPKIRGASVYTLSEEASDAEAKSLATKENTADVLAGIDLAGQSGEVGDILRDLMQRETMNLSKQFANVLVEHLGKVTPLLRNTHRFAGFAVLKSPVVPSVLVEMGYLSNRAEERLLLSSRHRATIVAATSRAIEAYLDWQEALNRT